MEKFVKNSNVGFNHENFGKVSFIIGRLYDELPSKYNDWDEIQILVENIATAWERFEDIRNFEEEGYIQAYAERIIREYIIKSA